MDNETKKAIDKLSKNLKSFDDRLSAIEHPEQITNKYKSSVEEDSLTVELDNLMKRHSDRFKNGLLFTAASIPSDKKGRLVRWSNSAGFENGERFDEFLNLADASDAAKVSSMFASAEKIKIIKAIIKDGPLSQKEILDATQITQGQFYHHVKDLITFNIVEKSKQDSYEITEKGFTFSLSFLSMMSFFLR